jgi:hypothetical protein
VRVTGAGGGALLDKHGKEGIEVVEQRVGAAGGQAADAAGEDGA